MKLKPEFIIHQSNGEALLVPLSTASFHGIVRGNETLGAILDLLKTDRTEEELVDAMAETYDAPRETIEADVRRVLTKLKDIGAIDA